MVEDRTRSAGFAAALAGAFIIGPLSLTIFIPALPAILQSFHADIQRVQLTVSLPLVAVILAAPFAGGLSDRIGRRPVVLASIAVLLLGCLACVAATSLWMLILGRVVVGVSGTCLLVVARAIVNDAYGRDDLTRAMARYSVAPVLAVLLAPMLGGILTEAFGWRSVFMALSAIAAMIGGLTRWLPETRVASVVGAVDESAAKSDSDRSRLLHSLVFWGYAWQSALHFAAAVGFVAAAPYLMVSQLGRSASEYGAGLLLVVGGLLIGVLVAERLAGRIDRRSQVLIGCAVGVAAGTLTPALLGLGSHGLSPGILFGPATAAAFGIGLAMPASQAGIVDAVPEASGLASGIAAGLKMLAAAAMAHLVVLPWASPGLALGWISLVTMLLATGAVAVAMIEMAKLAEPPDGQVRGADGTSP